MEFFQKKPWQKFCQVKCKRKYHGPRYREKYKEGREEYQTTPRFKYNVQKQTTKRRGLEFLLSFEDWWSLWESHWNNRGKSKESLVMCRYGDSGNYELGNVFIGTYSQNSREAALNFPREHSKINGRFI